MGLLSLSSLSLPWEIENFPAQSLNFKPEIVKSREDGKAKIVRSAEPLCRDAGVLMLVELCRELELLDVSGCDLVTNEAVTGCLSIVTERPHKLTLVVGGKCCDHFREPRTICLFIYISLQY